MNKVQILTACQACNGRAYVPVGEEVSPTGVKYIRHRPCSVCQGSGKQIRWIDVQEFANLLHSFVIEEQRV
jgi:DnaJ-class molecular chaperone